MSVSSSSVRRAVALALLASSAPAFAQDARTVEQVQAEVDRLKQLLQREEQALAEKSSQGGGAAGIAGGGGAGRTNGIDAARATDASAADGAANAPAGSGAASAA